MEKPKLTVKQERFITEYIKTGNATQSAIKAGYSKTSARVIGVENLTKLNSEIQSRLAKKNAKKVAQADEVLELLTKFARGKMQEEQIVVEGCGDGYSEAKIMKKKIANRDQLQALDKLARIHGLYNDRVNITSDNNQGDVISATLDMLRGRSIEDESEEEIEELDNE